MSKNRCLNKGCKRINVVIDVDPSLLAYYNNQKFSEFQIIDGVVSCVECGNELELITQVDKSKFATVLKFGCMNKEDKVKMLKKRSRDLTIPINKRIKDYKNWQDHN